MAELDVAPGTLLAEKYRVLRVIGQGGMGIVVEAVQLGLERRVALKFLNADSGRDPLVARLRFEREARAVARLRGEHVVQVYDVGQLDSGEPFIAMELLEGHDLSTLLAVNERMPVHEAVGYVLQACEALAEAHVAGVVHRDLKPANLFIARRPDGRPLLKVLDFGISKLTSGEDDVGLTSTRGLIGSPPYMSPEQLGSPKGVDHRTDVWSLGTVLWELVTGATPFQATSLAQVQVKILTAHPPDLASVLPDAPSGLEAVMKRCLEKDPAQRYQNTAQLALALEPFASKSALSSVGAAVRIVRGSALVPATCRRRRACCCRRRRR